MTTFLLVLMLLGQETVGSLSGLVMDEAGAFLPGVSITVQNKGTGRTLRTQTAYDGAYSARNLEPGHYSVEIALPGFSTVRYSDIYLLTAQRMGLTSTLRVGGPDVFTDIPDPGAGADMRGVTVAERNGALTLPSLPKGRSFQSLALMTPSVTAGEIEGGIQINGASGAENEFTIDGIMTNSLIDGRSRQDAAFEYLQEVHVKTAGVPAEHSGALGGVISAVTKSGGDRFHGEGFYYFSGDALSSTPSPRLFLDRRDDRTVGYIQDEKGSDRVQEPGIALGGPLRRDQLYFFSSISRRLRKQTEDYGFSYGAERGTLERTQRSLSIFNKLSYSVTPRLEGNVSWLYTPVDAKGTLPAYDAPGANWIVSTRAAGARSGEAGFFSPQSSYSAYVGYAPMERLALTGRAGFFRDNYKDTGIADSSSVSYQTSSAGLSFVPQNLQGPAGTQNFPAVQRSRQDLTKRLTAQGDAEYFADGLGSHDLKAGYSLRYAVNDVDIAYPGNGYVLVHWDRAFTSLVTGTNSRGLYGYYEIHQRGSLGSLKGLSHAVYGRDQWTINPRLTVNLGVRFERETLPAFPNRQAPATIPRKLEFEFADKISPRVGASFDLFGDGRTKLYGSWGRFFDWTKYTLMRGSFGGDIWTIRYRALDTLDVFSLGGANLPGRDLWNPSVTDSFRSRNVPSFGTGTADPLLKPASQDTYSAGVDYEWTRTRHVSVRYVHQELRRTIEDLSLVANGQEFLAYANPGESFARTLVNTTGLTAPFPYPKPVRRYDAVTFTISRMPSTGWFGDAAYTWSRLYGNYSGLASSDELRTPTTGTSNATSQQQGGSIARPGSYAKNNWDLDEVLFDSRGTLNPKGLLATHRTHVLKLKGGYRLSFGTEIGGFVFAGSGTPLTSKVTTTNFLPVFVEGRGDLGRTPTLAYADVLLAHNVRIDEERSIRIELNVLNAFDSKTETHRFEHLNRSPSMDLSRVDLRQGYNYRALIAASPEGQNAFDPRFNMADLFNPGFSARLGLKFMF